MSLFNKLMPWFIPTKVDQKGWYTDELKENPKEVMRLMDEFLALSKEYDVRLGNFEAKITEDYETYNEYMNIKSLAQKLSFLWGRIEYKKSRESELNKMLQKLI